jgi:outer membrane protein OmpA-like peptidoglycan-associated protein
MSREEHALAHVLAHTGTACRAAPGCLGLLLLALGAIAPTPAAVPAGAAPPAPPPPSWALRRELDRTQKQLAAAIQPLQAGAAVQILRDPHRVVLRIPARLLFDPDSAILREDPAARRLLMAVRQLLHKRTALSGRIEVFTDGIGGIDANLRSSQLRADALLAWFLEQGVPPARLSAGAQGASHPLASDEAPEGRMQNRRVELVFERKPAA